MSILSDIAKGFIWGIGFSIALLSVSIAYITNVHASAEAKFKDNISLIYDEKNTALSHGLNVEVIKSEINKHDITIYAKYKNFKISTVSALHMKIKYTIFDAQKKNEAPIAICEQPILAEKSGADYLYSITLCETPLYTPEKIDIRTSIIY